MYKIVLSEDQMKALKLVVGFADSQVDDGLGVFVDPAPCDIIDQAEADAQYEKQLRLKEELTKILAKATWTN